MFPVKHGDRALQRAATWAGITLSTTQIEQLGVFGDWLVDEALPAGAIGPDEADRIVDRHLADSLIFAAGWDTAPETLVDVGSGAGLPGIPLAIVFPATGVTLLDRSQRRADLLRRAVRVLDLDHAMVLEAEVETAPRSFAAATFRASVPPAAAMELVPRLVLPGGVAMIGLHRGDDPPPIDLAAAPDADIELVKTPPGVLDSPAWHLRMTLR